MYYNIIKYVYRKKREILNENTPMTLQGILREIGSWILYILLAFVIASLLNIFVFQITNVSGSSMYPTLHDGDLYVITKLGSAVNACPGQGDIIVIDANYDSAEIAPESHVIKRSWTDDFKDIFKYNVITSLFKPGMDHRYWVKRVIGLPGDTIELTDDGGVYRNGELLSEEYLNDETVITYAERSLTVPEGYIWVMGDNRNNSQDSRVIGCVPVENVIGTLRFCIRHAR